jgi:hypothetical protein
MNFFIPGYIIGPNNSGKKTLLKALTHSTNSIVFESTKTGYTVSVHLEIPTSLLDIKDEMFFVIFLFDTSNFSSFL